MSVEPVYRQLGLLVLAARHRAGLTQLQVGHVMGWAPSHVSQVELGQVRVYGHHLAPLASALRCSVADIVPGMKGLCDAE